MQAPVVASREPSALHQVVSVPFVGEYLALGLAAVPLLPLLLARALLRIPGEPAAAFWILCGIVTAGWLLFLQKRHRLTIRVPVFHIPVLWLMPAYALANVLDLVL